jgi:N-[(2S)-2-amino-2-carboxyethyl]-L-glutamate dehydrogenase
MTTQPVCHTQAASSLIESGELLYLNGRDVEALGVFDFAANRASVIDAYRAHWANDVRLPNSDYLKYAGRPSYDRVINLLGYLGGSTGVSGSKLICSSVGNRARGLPRASGLITLVDPVTQRPFCILEASRISAARTAAVTSVALAYLTAAPAPVAALIGCGYQASIHVRLMAALDDCRPRRLRLFDRHADAAVRLAADATALGLEAEVMASAEEAIRDADLVVPLTTAEAPYIEAAWLKRPSLYAAVSLLDATLGVFEQADLVVVDDEESCKHEGRPLQQLEKRGTYRDLNVVTIGRLVSEGFERPPDRDLRIVFNPMGTVITDIAVAVRLFERAMAGNAGARLALS